MLGELQQADGADIVTEAEDTQAMQAAVKDHSVVRGRGLKHSLAAPICTVSGAVLDERGGGEVRPSSHSKR